MSFNPRSAEELYRLWLSRNNLEMRQFRVQALEALTTLANGKRFHLEDFLQTWTASLASTRSASLASTPSAYRVLEELVNSGVLHRTTLEIGSENDYVWEFPDQIVD